MLIINREMNRSHVLDNGPSYNSGLPSICRPNGWELAGNRRRPYSATGLTPRVGAADDYGHVNHLRHHYHRHHVCPTSRDELLHPRGDSQHHIMEVNNITWKALLSILLSFQNLLMYAKLFLVFYNRLI